MTLHRGWSSKAAWAAAILALVATGSVGRADELPKATQDILQSLQMGPDILSGLDAELKVPAAWINGARQEAKLKISGSWDPPQFAHFSLPFKERYPYIKIDYSRGSFNTRSIALLVAFQQGRVIADVLTGFGGTFSQFKDAGALANISDIPNVANVPPQMKDPGGLWAGHQMTFYCMTYNTNLLKKEDLPRTWDDLLTNPKFRDQHLGVGDRPQLWLIALTGARGELWADNFIGKLFTDVKPQLRKEGLNATVSLTGIGELTAALPTSGYRTRFDANKGSPISFHCPEPVPGSTNEMAIMRHAPDNNAAHLFMNWALSKEGQVSQFETDGGSPTHKAFQNDDRFIAYADTIRGKEIAFRTPELLAEQGPRVIELWEANWKKIMK
jgi:ABC-type Fe3+ transport system substrate-binding protein